MCTLEMCGKIRFYLDNLRYTFTILAGIFDYLLCQNLTRAIFLLVTEIDDAKQAKKYYVAQLILSF